MLKKLELYKKFVGGIGKGYANSLIAVSRAGMGKTETTLVTLKELGYKEGKHYIYINSYITPLELYKQLQRANDLDGPKILILDDCEEIFKNKITASLLKGALWHLPNGLRKVCWYSTTSKVQNKSFYFEGKVILLLNSFNRNNPSINAVADRGYYYEFNMTNGEILSLIKERAKRGREGLSRGQRKNIVAFLSEYGSRSDRLSLRILEQAYRLFLLSPNHWKELIKELLK